MRELGNYRRLGRLHPDSGRDAAEVVDLVERGWMLKLPLDKKRIPFYYINVFTFIYVTGE
jgi:hypothetical protein